MIKIYYEDNFRNKIEYHCQENRHVAMLPSSLCLPNRRYLIKFMAWQEVDR